MYTGFTPQGLTVPMGISMNTQRQISIERMLNKEGDGSQSWIVLSQYYCQPGKQLAFMQSVRKPSVTVNQIHLPDPST